MRRELGLSLMKQQNKTAVFLRGYQRLFEYTHHNIFGTFESIYGADNIDWYIAFWRTSSTDIVDLQKKFINKHLIHCELVDEAQYPIPLDIETYSNIPWRSYRPYYWRLAYLDHLLNIRKCKIEVKTNAVYNTVVFARPDVIYNCTNTELESVPLRTFYINSQYSCLFQTRYCDISTCDLYYKSDSITADIISARFLDTFKTDLIHPNAHAMLAAYINRNHILPNTSSHITAILVRPDTLDVLEKSEFDVDFEENRWSKWVSKPIEYRRNLCISLGIDPKEYSVS